MVLIKIVGHVNAHFTLNARTKVSTAIRYGSAPYVLQLKRLQSLTSKWISLVIIFQSLVFLPFESFEISIEVLRLMCVF